MLYPTTISPDPNVDGFHIIPSGNLFCFPVVLEADSLKHIMVVHVAGSANQDFSLRVWVSVEPGDRPAVETPYYIIWYANRNDAEITTIYDEANDAPAFNTTVPLPPGNYTVNVLNLVNRENAFTIVLTDEV